MSRLRVNCRPTRLSALRTAGEAGCPDERDVEDDRIDGPIASCSRPAQGWLPRIARTTWNTPDTAASRVYRGTVGVVTWDDGAPNAELMGSRGATRFVIQ